MQATQESVSAGFDPKRVETQVGGVRLLCPEHNYPVMKDGVGNPICFHHTCRFDWTRLLVQLPKAFEPAQAAALLGGLPLAQSVQVFLDLERSNRGYARSLRKLLPQAVGRAVRGATLVPAGAAG